jgi:spore coat polysaccharide biosynthesis protein SpsF
MSKVVIITQARLSSSRLPEKVLKCIGSKSLLMIHLQRLKKVKLAQEIIVATTFEDGIEKLLIEVKSIGVKSFQGSTTDVLTRFYEAAKNSDGLPEIVVRVTSDCPLIDPDLIDKMLQEFMHRNVDYSSNVLRPTFPDGFDVEIISWKALEQAYHLAKRPYEREHVTPYIWENTDFMGKNMFKAFSYESEQDFSSLRMTVDTLVDFERVKILIEALGEDQPWRNYVNYYLSNPQLFKDLLVDERNLGFQRN